MSDPQFLQPYSSCSSCIDTLDDLDWVAASTFRVGPWALGVRTSDTGTDEALRRVLAAHLEDVEAPVNFSALMADGHGRRFNFLYQASDTLVRTRAPGRVLRTLMSHLSDFAEPPVDAMRLHATGLIVDGHAIVAPDQLRAEMSTVETRLNAAGISVIDAPMLQLEPGTGHVIVPEPALTIDDDALRDYEREHPALGRELPAVPAGRYPIMAWAVVTGEDRVGPVGAAQAVAAAAQQVGNAESFGAQPTLDIVAAAVAGIPVSGMWWHDSRELIGQLRDLARSAA